MGWRDAIKGRNERESFVADLVSRARKTRGVERVAFGDEDVILLVTRAGEKGPEQINLHNLWADVQRTPDKVVRRQMVERFVRGMMDVNPPPESWEQAAPLLMPAVRAGDYANALLSAGSMDADKQPVRGPLADQMDVFLVIDRPDSMQFVNNGHVGQWGIDPAIAFVRARENLRAHELMVVPLPGVPGAVRPAGPDGYVSSWAVFPADIARAADGLAGDPIILVPTRDLLAFVGTDDLPGLTKALAWARDEYFNSPRSISPLPYAIADDALVVWEPPDGHATANHVAGAHAAVRVVAYTQQQGPLQQRLGEAIFVSSLKLVDRPDGKQLTLTAWTDGVPALLPRADIVVLNQVDDRGNRLGVPLPVAWDDLVPIVAPLMVGEPDLDPPRWRVQSWPTPEMIERLRTLAVE